MLLQILLRSLIYKTLSQVSYCSAYLSVAVGLAEHRCGLAEQPWLLPRAANPQYVGYTHIQDRMEGCLLAPTTVQLRSAQLVCVLSGMGGVGKSETILHFIAKNEEAIRAK